MSLFQWISSNKEYITEHYHDETAEKASSDIGFLINASHLRFMIYKSFPELKAVKTPKTKTTQGAGFDPTSLIEGYQALSARLRRIEEELGMVNESNLYAVKAA